MGSVGSNTTYSVPPKQSEWEEKYRYSSVEHGAYFDKDGNVLAEGTGTDEEISFDAIEINHNVEQRVWNDEEVNFAHNHTINSIFSPNDVEAFEDMENHSMRATLPNGTDYTLIRTQPQTSREWVYDTSINDYIRKFEPKKIAPDYRKEYDKIWDPEWKRIKATTSYGSPERKQAEAELDKKVAEHMEEWLRKNAKSYGYRFVKGGK